MARKDDAQRAAQALSATSYFADLDDGALQALARAARRLDFGRDGTVFVEGEPCTGLYLIDDGWLKAVKMSIQGREQVLRFVGPGEVVNEVGVFADMIYCDRGFARKPKQFLFVESCELERLHAAWSARAANRSISMSRPRSLY